MDRSTSPCHHEAFRFIAKASAAAAVVDAPNVIANPKVQRRMSTAWPPRPDVVLGGAERFAKVVEERSGGLFRIEGYPGGQIMPAFA